MATWVYLNERISVGGFHSVSLDTEILLDAQNEFEISGSSVLFDLSFFMRVDGWDGESMFSCNICSENNVNLVPSRGASIIVRQFSFEKLRSQLIARINECKDPRAFHCIVMLRNKFDWEYEGIISDAELRSRLG